MNIRGQKKIIIINAVAFIAILASTVFILSLTAPRNSTPLDAVDQTTIAGDTACTIVTRAAVERAVSGKAAKLHETIAAGQGEMPNKDTVDVCIYPFVSDAAIENNYRMENAVSVELYRHVDQASVQKFKDTHGAATKAVTTLKTESSFREATFSDGSVRYELFVYTGTTHYTFRIGLPEGSNTFDSSSAENALTTLARSASL